MVALSKLLLGSFLYVAPKNYEQVATLPQAALEQYNFLHYLSGAGPYIQNPGFGISGDIPDQCSLEQVHLFSRHGARYPTKNAGKRFEDVIDKLLQYNGTFTGDLEFLNTYEYFAKNHHEWYEKETTPLNSNGQYTGIADSHRHGTNFRKKYGSLYDGNSKLPIFTSNSGRVYESAKSFAIGFLGSDYAKEKVIYSIIDESGDQGLNSLTPRYACGAYNKTINDEFVNKYDKSYLQDIVTRFVKNHQHLKISAEDVEVLFQYIAYEINVKGYSPFAKLFTNDEYVKYGYGEDLSKYYANSRGNNITRVIGSVMLNATLTLLKQQHHDDENKIWISFSHDTDWEILHSALGIFGPKENLPVDHIPFPNPYIHAHLLPQGGRLIAEKFNCNGSLYVRFVLNDAVYPIPGCTMGPGFSCKLEEFETYIHQQIAGFDVIKQCKVSDHVPQHLSFFWDFRKVSYNASIIDN